MQKDNLFELALNLIDFRLFSFVDGNAHTLISVETERGPVVIKLSKESPETYKTKSRTEIAHDIEKALDRLNDDDYIKVFCSAARINDQTWLVNRVLQYPEIVQQMKERLGL